ncbi:sensor histidine kinase [Lysobacter niastensis]|uniref:histidine kinase n=1 Tax=Lysobacter niastensis TaxID=380629 RepID=A0ABS0B7A6_9GAMM|nr:ATP-binding protein [Lysobacter niastensis]MBF6023539.1 sensor histidine kinase [Lysobacter niastensis]
MPSNDDAIAALLRRIRAAIAPAMRWLSNVPIEDPIDRRNAPTMQLLFFVFGTTLPLSWARHLASITEIPKGWLLIGAMDMVTAALAFCGITMIRRGRFRHAVTMFVSALLVALFIGHLAVGFQKHAIDQTSQMLTLSIGGLVLGRRALWGVFLALIAAFTAGFGIDALEAHRRGESIEMAFHFLPSAAFSYFVVTLVLDRCITALRSSLSESQERGRELSREIAERERAQSQLVHAQKMEAVGRLASGVAHDFNNILGVVVGYTEARHQLDDTDVGIKAAAYEMADALEGIEHTANKGMNLTRQLLCFSRQDPSRPVIVCAGEAIRDIEPMLRRLLPRSIGLSLDVPGEAMPVHIDRGQFELAVLNIASNSRDAMPAGGKFHVQVRQAGASIEIRMSDDGPGIPKQIIDRVFEPFFSTKPAGTGTGLGLATAHALVTAVKGRIHLESEPGRGTTACISLPLAASEPVPLAATAYALST